MPPKKKARISTAASPIAPPSTTKDTLADPFQDDNNDDDDEEAAAAAAQAAAQAEVDAKNVADPWTDDEEIGLFKGLIKWKPTGIHKNFRMLSLQQYLLSNGYIHPDAQHTRIPGIWAKLRDLYDLDALDQREDAHALPWDPAPEDDDVDELGNDNEEDEREAEEDFELPDDDEFAVMKWRQRFPTNQDDEEREESPPAAEELVTRPDSPPMRFVPTFDINESEEKATPSRKGKIAGTPASKSKTAKGPRTSMAAVATRRSSLRVADSVDPDEEDEEEDEEADESGEDSKAGSTASGTPAPKGRSRPPTRSKPVKGRAKRKR